MMPIQLSEAGRAIDLEMRQSGYGILPATTDRPSIPPLHSALVRMRYSDHVVVIARRATKNPVRNV